MYKDEYHPRIKKDIKKLDPYIREKIKTQYIPNIQQSPNMGSYLKGDLNVIRSYHITIAKQQYRIAYLVDESNEKVIILMIAKRENFYNLLKNRIQ